MKAVITINVGNNEADKQRFQSWLESSEWNEKVDTLKWEGQAEGKADGEGEGDEDEGKRSEKAAA